MQARGEALGRDGSFPAAEMAALHGADALVPELPICGTCRDDAAVDALADLLIQVGRGNLSVGRILEAHINTLHLAARYGSSTHWEKVRHAAQEGRLFALWVTDPPEGGLLMQRQGSRIRLSGAKQFCSGAGYANGTLL